MPRLDRSAILRGAGRPPICCKVKECVIAALGSIERERNFRAWVPPRLRQIYFRAEHRFLTANQTLRAELGFYCCIGDSRLPWSGTSTTKGVKRES